ncbi:MAG: hypothetical protein RIR11_4858 [Bacteroidota bacterium]|jgi:hypothetical protein
MHIKFIFSLFLVFITGLLSAQGTTKPDTSSTQGGWVRREIINGDTFYLSTLRTVKVAAPRQYKDRAERDRLARYRRYAANVYPYAVQAIELYDDLQASKEEQSKRQHRRYVRQQKKVFKEDFEDKLKSLYRTEGQILIKMIERQTGQPCYDIVKEARGGVTAMYWQNLSKLWGFNLKDGYKVGDDPILDEVLLDYDFGDAIWRY